MSGDRHADGGAHRKPLLSLEQEGLLLIIWAFGALWGSLADALFPAYWVLPGWLNIVLLVLWFPAFFQWAAKGGVPPRW